MTDIVKRLHSPEFADVAAKYLMIEAAHEIERLREALEIISKPTYGTELFDTAGQRA